MEEKILKNVCRICSAGCGVNVHVKDNVMGIRDLKGACRFLEFGNLPMPNDVKEFHKSKVAEREAAEGTKMDYNISLKDFWAFSKGNIKGMPPYTT